MPRGFTLASMNIQLYVAANFTPRLFITTRKIQIYTIVYFIE